jgi:hypothetical protein
MLSELEIFLKLRISVGHVFGRLPNPPSQDILGDARLPQMREPEPAERMKAGGLAQPQSACDCLQVCNLAGALRLKEELSRFDLLRADVFTNPRGQAWI